MEAKKPKIEFEQRTTYLDAINNGNDLTKKWVNTFKPPVQGQYQTQLSHTLQYQMSKFKGKLVNHEEFEHEGVKYNYNSDRNAYCKEVSRQIKEHFETLNKKWKSKLNGMTKDDKLDSSKPKFFEAGLGLIDQAQARVIPKERYREFILKCTEQIMGMEKSKFFENLPPDTKKGYVNMQSVASDSKSRANFEPTESSFQMPDVTTFNTIITSNETPSIPSRINESSKVESHKPTTEETKADPSTETIAEHRVKIRKNHLKPGFKPVGNKS
jgi:hypothetical protein